MTDGKAANHVSPPAGRLVAVAEPPGPAFVAALDAAWQRGDAVLPLDPRAPRATRDRLTAAMGVGEPVDDGTALVILTSGSTGDPKGAVLSHRAVQASAAATTARIGVEPDDHWLSCLPWQHVGGLQVLLRARLTGARLTVHETFDVARVRAERDSTLVALVPTQLVRLLDEGVDLTRFRVVLLGGAAAPQRLLERAAEAGARVVTTYGMSETSGGCVYDGRPLDGVGLRLGPDGRIFLRGPVLMDGYRDRPDLDREVFDDGWLRTNDAGELTADGRLVVRGRVDDVVITGGENVDTNRVAAILAEHPDVGDVAVTGVDDPEWGQRVVAVVVPRAAAPTLPELRRWVAERASAAAAPRQLVLAEEIPRLSSGKTDRLAVRAMAVAHSGAPRQDG